MMKIVISDPKSGKSYQSEVPKDAEAQLAGRKIGDSIDGGIVGAAGYKLRLTGGSDGSGFPMRQDISGARRIAALISDGTGFHAKHSGARERRMVRGNAFSGEVAQVNAVVVEAGPSPLEQLFPKAAAEKK